MRGPTIAQPIITTERILGGYTADKRAPASSQIFQRVSRHSPGYSRDFIAPSDFRRNGERRGGVKKKGGGLLFHTSCGEPRVGATVNLLTPGGGGGGGRYSDDGA